MPAAWIEGLVQPGRELRGTGNGVLCALGPDDPGSPYDRRAATYDRLVGNSLYNRVVWSSSPASYAAFAATAVADSDGPLLDVGCGSAVFTADAYRSTGRALILVDRSLGMLALAAERLRGHDPARVAFVQADLFDLPFRPGSFTTVTCHGLLHLFDNPAEVIRALRAHVAPAGSLYATSLVAETAIGGRALALLHRAGEAAIPRRERELATVARAELGALTEVRREGSMVFLTAVPRHAGISHRDI